MVSVFVTGAVSERRAVTSVSGSASGVAATYALLPGVFPGGHWDVRYIGTGACFYGACRELCWSACLVQVPLPVLYASPVCGGMRCGDQGLAVLSFVNAASG